MNKPFSIIMVVALVTLFIRMAPFVLFNNKESKIINYLGDVLPYAIMPLLVVYCLKSVNLLSGNHGLSEIISVATVILVHVYKRNTLASILIGTIVYMVCVQAIFI